MNFNVDEQPKLAERYDIRAIPTLLLFVDGKVVKTNVGLIKKEALLQLLDDATRKKQPAWLHITTFTPSL